MKFAIITGTSIHHKYIVNKLYAIFPKNFHAVVIQKDIKTRSNLKKNLSFTGFLYWVHNIFFKLYRTAYFKFNLLLKKDLPNLYTDDVNSKAVIDFLKDRSIDYVFVCGGKIIKSQILALWKYKIINLHNGYSPQYRGSNTLFWPIIENSRDTGITIHYLTKDLDGGQIIMRERIMSDRFLYPETLQIYSFYRTTVLVETIINMLILGIKLPKIDSKISNKVYYSREFTSDIKLRLRKKILLNYLSRFL